MSGAWSYWFVLFLAVAWMALIVVVTYKQITRPSIRRDALPDIDSSWVTANVELRGAPQRCLSRVRSCLDEFAGFTIDSVAGSHLVGHVGALFSNLARFAQYQVVVDVQRAAQEETSLVRVSCRIRVAAVGSTRSRAEKIVTEITTRISRRSEHV